MWEFLRNIIKSFLNIFRSQKRTTSRPYFQSQIPPPQRTVSHLTNTPIKRIIKSGNQFIKKPSKSYWEKKGWVKKIKKRSCTYHGYYQTIYGNFRGMVEDKNCDSSLNFYIYDPPGNLENHPYWSSFIDQGKGEFLLLFYGKPMDIDSGIIVIERVVHEAFSKY